MSYAPSMVYATNVSTDSSMTYAPSMVYATNISTESSMSTDSSIITTTTVQGCTCGKKKVGTENKDTRIVGGEAAEVNEWPWMAAISYSTTGAGYAYGCGASLISAEWLVTAAHCFYDAGVQAVFPSGITVVIGDHDKSLETDSNIKLVQYVDKILIHPEYNDALSKNDIALIKMTTKVDLDIYTPVCLPSLNQQFSGDSWVYGWGTLQPSGSQPDILQEISLPVIDTSLCTTIMALQDVTIYPGMICAGGQSGKDSCQGDSGGPMTVALNETHYLAGAVSFGIGCGQEGLYGVYAQVSYYLTWINTKISENGGAEYCPY